jgi:hypothetical protein
VKRGGSLSYLMIFTFAIPELLDLDMTENSMFTLCRMITWVVFLRMLWNFISSLPVKRGGSLSFLVGTISNVWVMEIGWTDVGSGGYILVSCAYSNTSFMWNIHRVNEFRGVRVTRSLVFCVCFVDGCLSFCNFSFVRCVVCSIYGFWVFLWYLQTKHRIMCSR